MNKEEFELKIKKVVKKSAAVSKEAFEKAGDKVQSFTDKSVLLLEKKKLENKRAQKYSELGEKIFSLIESEDLKIEGAGSEMINEIVSSIISLNEQIKQNEQAL